MMVGGFAFRGKGKHGRGKGRERFSERRWNKGGVS